MTDRVEFTTRAEHLRSTFDSSFTKPVELAVLETEDFLLLQLGSSNVAVRLSGISGLFVDRKVTKLPGSPPELMGISGFRGITLPVYDLQAIVGNGRASAPRWVMIVAAAPLALAFSHSLGHRRFTSRDIRRDEAASGASSREGEFVPADDGRGHHPVVDLRIVVDTIMRGFAVTPKSGSART